LYENILAYSRDQQTAGLSLSVNYRFPADQVETIYREYGGEAGVISRLLDRQVLEEVKNVFGKFNASTAIQERERLAAEVQMAIQKAVIGPIIVESVQIENIDFDEKMQTLKTEFADLLKAEAASKNDLLTVFKELGYEIKL
jgi:regulator of protease activity HflC (stomatin/prohibitin superfamily)